MNMQDLNREAADARRVLDAHLAEMEGAATTIEAILGQWAQQWCQSTVDAAVANDSHRTVTLQSAGTFQQLLDEVAQLKAELPERIRAGFRRSVWRHIYVDPSRDGSGRIMNDLDYGIWQHSGYKVPPAMEGVVSNALSRVTQLLRKYGYRPEFGRMAGVHRHTAPPDAIAPMERYYQLSMRLADVAAAAEEARARLSGISTDPSWDAR